MSKYGEDVTKSKEEASTHHDRPTTKPLAQCTGNRTWGKEYRLVIYNMCTKKHTDELCFEVANKLTIELYTYRN